MRALAAVVATASAVFLAAALLLALLTEADADDFPNCRGFIPHECCCTNNCCFEIKPHEVVAVDPEGDEWMIAATGERIKRTVWSEDGKWYRCACEWRDGRYVIDRKDRTRCIVPAKAEAGT